MVTKKAPKLKKATSVLSSMEGDSRSSINVSEKELPAIKNWKIGEKYKLKVEVEMTGIRKEDYGQDQGKLYANFRINKIATEEKE